MINLNNISHQFTQTSRFKYVLSNINLNIRPNEIFGLIGDTGSGKSTLLRIMNGFINPTEGSVTLMGQPLNNSSKHRLVKRTSMIFQDFNLLSNLNVLDNILLPGKLRNNKDIELGKKYLNYVGLKGFEDRKIASLSGGQKQRVAIARSLMSEPEIIFCDEPTSALDSHMRDEVLSLLKTINKDLKTTIVIVSHDLNVIKSMCDRVAIIEDTMITEVLDIKKQDIRQQSYLETLQND